MEELVKEHILNCEEIISNNNNSSAAKDLAKLIVSAYGEYIAGIRNGLDMSSYNKQVDYLGDIKKLKVKLQLFLSTDCKPTKLLRDVNGKDSVMITNTNNNSNENTNTNNIKFEVLFKEARAEIEENESISEEEMKEVLDKIDKIEEISKLDESNKKKWFKLKPMMQWVGTKGISIATTVLNLVTAILKFQSK